MLIQIEENLNLFESYNYIIDYLYSLHEKLSKEERDKLSDSCFGIPETRSYPMPDPEHVKYAIRMFNFCKSPEKEKRLAYNIIKFIKEYNLDISSINVGKSNRFNKYWIAYKNSLNTQY